MNQPPTPPQSKRGLPTWAIVTIAVAAGVFLCCLGGVIIAALNMDTGPTPEAADAPTATTPTTPAPAATATTAPPTPANTAQPTSASPTPLLTVPDDLAGQNAAVVEDRLRQIGFTNIQFGSADQDDTVVILPQNWTVTEVSPEPGSEIRADSTVVLTCTKQ